MVEVRHNVGPNLSNASPDNLEEAMWQLKIDHSREGAERLMSPYPDRPGEPNCLYYLRTGNCRYGSSCKYNHPTYTGENNQFGSELPQRDGQPDCQFFLKTGTCKYGTTCKYHHPREKHNTKLVQLNVLGLPIRKDEKHCAYYMKTGSCKYGYACKFNHPDPQPATTGATIPLTGSSAYGYSNSVTTTSAPPVIGGLSSWSLSSVPYMSSPHMHALPAYVPLVLPPTQGTMGVQQGWSTYMGSMNHMTSVDGHPPNQISNSKHRERPDFSLPQNLPERPDQPECQYYMKTGSCKYGISCKYHHPKEHNQAAIGTIGPLGLPLRPGQPVCTFYTAYGSCKFGTACRYDHPIIGYYGYTLPSFSYPISSVALSNQNTKSLKLPGQFSKSGRHNLENHEHGNTSTDTPSKTEAPEESP
ncbi:zinc finger CCCH domain-containing protein ZFN-like [Zingiber officinale]|uniref:C3H1-type domain-containing protein n=1 Tax=Zingiber officinale TaxID=94328 RepID=A0A8J5HIG6_ZINOF|nr:zinc finger CCCH domain-containing protein ZFN-like [Zingiber officinale]KAG6525267.1 hypothetical protein ZIOFF_015221 [Zingiber officinale]